MRDRDIRICLRAQLDAEHAGEGALILDELGVCEGAARADMAVINGSIAAWEIKSERDTLRRLDGQVRAYGRVCDYVTLVAAPAHVKKIGAELPAWWGLSVATLNGAGEVVIERKRRARANRKTDPDAVARLLWREEALAVLETHGLAHGLRSKPRRALWAALAAQLPAAELAGEVRAALRARGDWRAAPRPR